MRYSINCDLFSHVPCLTSSLHFLPFSAFLESIFLNFPLLRFFLLVRSFSPFKHCVKRTRKIHHRHSCADTRLRSSEESCKIQKSMKNYTHSRSIQHRYQELQNTITRVTKIGKLTPVFFFALLLLSPLSSALVSSLPVSFLPYCTETWLCSSLPFSSLHFSSLLVSVRYSLLFPLRCFPLLLFSCDSRLSGNSRCLYETAFEQSEWLL